MASKIKAKKARQMIRRQAKMNSERFMSIVLRHMNFADRLRFLLTGKYGKALLKASKELKNA